MSQTYATIADTDTLAASRSTINNNFSAVQSRFSGTAFPTLNLQVGMQCYREDTGKTYTLTATGPEVWTLVEDTAQIYIGRTDADARYHRQGAGAKADLILDGKASGGGDVVSVVLRTFAGIVRWTLDKVSNNDLEFKRYDATGNYVDSPISVVSGELRSLGQKVFHAGNDGSGSGLDADTLRNTTPGTAGLNILSKASVADVLAALGIAQANTGDMKPYYGKTSVPSGWVRCNGRTIGNTSSGATGRANADCEALFLHLWAEDVNLVVSGGRGASAAADWTANKTIALPDAKGSTLVGLDTMGGTAAGRLTAAVMSSGGIDTLGGRGGSAQVTLTEGQLPPHDHGVNDAGHTHNSTVETYNAVAAGGARTALMHPSSLSNNGNYSIPSNLVSSGISIQDAGGGEAHTNMPPFLLVTWLIKL